MIAFQTRSYAEDYSFFCVSEPETLWATGIKGTYKCFNKDVGKKIFIEIENENFKCLLGRFPSCRKDKVGTSISATFYIEGKCGDENADFVYRLVSVVMEHKSLDDGFAAVGKIFDNYFDEEFINSLDGVRYSKSAEDKIQEKISQLRTEFLQNDKSGSCDLDLTEFSGKIDFENYDEDSRKKILKLVVSVLCSKQSDVFLVLVATDSFVEKGIAQKFVENLMAEKDYSWQGVVASSNMQCLPFSFPTKNKEDDNNDNDEREKEIDDVFGQLKERLKILDSTTFKIAISVLLGILSILIFMPKAISKVKDVIENIRKQI